MMIGIPNPQCPFILCTYLDVLDSNVGSIMYPLRYADECTCCSDYIPADTIQPWTWERGHMEMPSRENTETINA